jgi:hypothetical protein
MALGPTRENGASASLDDSKEPKEGRKTPFGSRLLPLKLQIFLRGVYFVDARERFIGPARTFFSFSASKRRVLLLGGRKAVSDRDSEGLREATREWGILLLLLKLRDFGGARLP